MYNSIINVIMKWVGSGRNIHNKASITISFQKCLPALISHSKCVSIIHVFFKKIYGNLDKIYIKIYQLLKFR